MILHFTSGSLILISLAICWSYLRPRHIHRVLSCANIIILQFFNVFFCLNIEAVPHHNSSCLFTPWCPVTARHTSYHLAIPFSSSFPTPQVRGRSTACSKLSEMFPSHFVQFLLTKFQRNYFPLLFLIIRIDSFLFSLHFPFLFCALFGNRNSSSRPQRYSHSTNRIFIFRPQEGRET